MKNKIDRILDNLEKGIGVSLFGMVSYTFINADTLSFVKVCILIWYS